MLEYDVKYILAKLGLKWEDFILFMRGQTMSEDGEGNTVYWTEDVKRFLCEQLCEKQYDDFD